MENIKISRYPSEHTAASALHRLDDALDLLSFLKAEEFVTSELIDNHSKSQSSAKKYAKRIASHATLASQYAALSLKAPPEISFLPGYYCILNLAKCISLSGPFANEFNRHSRWHGATYNARGRASQSVLTDEVTVRRGGALALFYKTLTNETITADKVLKLKDFYHLIPGIGSELSIVTGKTKNEWFVDFSAEENAGKVHIEAELLLWDRDQKKQIFKGNVRSIPCLKGFKKKPKKNGVFIKTFAATPGLNLTEEVRSVVRTEYLNYIMSDAPYGCHEQGVVLPMPEEFASALAFFHLSSVCRYNPEFMEKLSKSKAWPMLLALRRHSLYYFMNATWSYVTQKNYILTTS